MSLALESALHWEGLAKKEDERAAYEAALGRYAGVHVNKATLYRRTAEAIRMEDRDGRPYCVCCLKPLALTLDKSGRHA